MRLFVFEGDVYHADAIAAILKTDCEVIICLHGATDYSVTTYCYDDEEETGKNHFAAVSLWKEALKS